jgi:hypothetical protein
MMLPRIPHRVSGSARLQSAAKIRFLDPLALPPFGSTDCRVDYTTCIVDSLSCWITIHLYESI